MGYKTEPWGLVYSQTIIKSALLKWVAFEKATKIKKITTRLQMV
jgi:hypothetical protein